MSGIIKMVIDKCSPSYTQYRFNKASNFVTYEEFCEERAIDSIIKLGKELERIKNFKKNTDEELEAMNRARYDIHHDAVNNISIDDRNHIYYKNQGIDAHYELLRRKNLK